MSIIYGLVSSLQQKCVKETESKKTEHILAVAISYTIDTGISREIQLQVIV